VFIGHYGVSLAAKPLAPRLSLGWLFLAVQLLDILFSIFVLLGIEKMRIVHGFTAYNPYDLYWMPYSHSLVGAFAWSLLAAGAYLAATRCWPPSERRMAAVVFGTAVFSHFVLDVPVHTPDLPLGFGAGSPRIGLGLWNHPVVTIALELAVLVAGGIVYLRATRAKSRAYAVTTVVFGAVLVVLTIGTRFQPDPASGHAFAIRALVSYVVLAVAAGVVDCGRPMREPPSGRLVQPKGA
jgi:hypothetical protein